MSGAIATLALAAIAWGLMAAATAAGVALLWPLWRRLRRGGSPEARAREALCAAVAPSALPALLIAVCLFPGLLAASGLRSDHCLRHPDHPHLCLAHPRASLPLAAAAIAAALCIAGAAVAGRAGRVALGHRALAGLSGAAGEPLAPGVRRVASGSALCVTAGLLRPRIFVSNALVRALPSEQLDAVIEHERAHARRRDPLRQLAARVLSWPHLPRLRRRLLDELSLATERSCDEDAGRRIGDRLRVAESILTVERLAMASLPAMVAEIGGSSVAERVRGLLDAPPPASRGGAFWIACGALVGLAFYLADPLHHEVEHALARLVHWL